MWASVVGLAVPAALLCALALQASVEYRRLRAMRAERQERQAAAWQGLEREVERLRAEAGLLRAEANARRDQMARFKQALWAKHRIAVVDLLDPPELDAEPPAAGADQGSATAEAA